MSRSLQTRQNIGTMIIGLALAAGTFVVACTPTQQDRVLASQPGQLFCAIQAAGGGQIVVGLINAAVPPNSASPLIVLATGATKAFVDAACASAAGAGKTGIPVSPPTTPVPQVAVVV